MPPRSRGVPCVQMQNGIHTEVVGAGDGQAVERPARSRHPRRSLMEGFVLVMIAIIPVLALLFLGLAFLYGLVREAYGMKEAPHP